MKISVVTLSYNQRRFLERAIDSVLGQEYGEIQYIVVDPGSSDGSRELVEGYGGRIVRLFEADEGPADGLRKGFSLADGEIFCFLNADDYFLPGCFRTVAAFFAEHGLGCFVSGRGFMEFEDGRRRPIEPTRLTRRRMLAGAATLFQQGTFFPGALYHAVGGINPANRTCWDGELFLDLVLAGHPHHLLDRELAVFGIHADSITGSGRLGEAYRAELARIFRERTGREFGWGDAALKLLFRLEKRAGWLLRRWRSASP